MRSDLSALVVPLGELSRQQAVRYGPRTLFVCGGTRRTYAEFDERSTRLAGGLQGRGVRKGDRVACYLPNSIELIEAYYATSKAGAVTVFLNALLTARGIRYILSALPLFHSYALNSCMIQVHREGAPWHTRSA